VKNPWIPHGARVYAVRRIVKEVGLAGYERVWKLWMMRVMSQSTAEDDVTGVGTGESEMERLE